MSRLTCSLDASWNQGNGGNSDPEVGGQQKERAFVFPAPVPTATFTHTQKKTMDTYPSVCFPESQSFCDKQEGREKHLYAENRGAVRSQERKQQNKDTKKTRAWPWQWEVP